jgi:hypothetical protein
MLQVKVTVTCNSTSPRVASAVRNAFRKWAGVNHVSVVDLPPLPLLHRAQTIVANLTVGAYAHELLSELMRTPHVRHVSLELQR